MTVNADLLVLAPHPDDAEICCGGLILQLTSSGRRVVVADLTRGEKGSFGTPQQRLAECEAATAVLELHRRVNLELPDTGLRDDDDAVRAVIEVLRAERPRVLAAPLEHDAHPDHAATGRIARRAWFLAGLKNAFADAGEAWRPRHLLRYPLHDVVEPTFCVDIAAVADRKLEAVRCYASQIGGAAGVRTGLDPLQRAEARDRYFGSRIGTRAAEPYATDGPLALENITCLL